MEPSRSQSLKFVWMNSRKDFSSLISRLIVSASSDFQRGTGEVAVAIFLWGPRAGVEAAAAAELVDEAADAERWRVVWARRSADICVLQYRSVL